MNYDTREKIVSLLDDPGEWEVVEEYDGIKIRHKDLEFTLCQKRNANGDLRPVIDGLGYKSHMFGNYQIAYKVYLLHNIEIPSLNKVKAKEKLEEYVE